MNQEIKSDEIGALSREIQTYKLMFECEAEMRSKLHQQVKVLREDLELAHAHIHNLQDAYEVIKYYADIIPDDQVAWLNGKFVGDIHYFNVMDEDDCSPVTSQKRYVGGKRARAFLEKVKEKEK